MYMYNYIIFFNYLIITITTGSWILTNFTFHHSKSKWSGNLHISDSHELSPLKFDIYNQKIARIKIYPDLNHPNHNHKRWEIPNDYYFYKNDHQHQHQHQHQHHHQHQQPVHHDELYRIITNQNPFNLKVYRLEDQILILEIEQLKHFQDQLLSFTIRLNTRNNDDDEKVFLYGLGERTLPFLLPKNKTFTIFNKNNENLNNEGVNLYGSHPFYMQVQVFENNGLKSSSTHGVFLLNSNGMDIEYTNDNRLKYNIIGGVIDLFVLPGETPEKVLKQYFSIIGKPKMIPAFALGYHQSKYGYKSVDELRHVVKMYKESNIPLESIWSDVDYMNGFKVFTINDNYKDLGMFINELHKNNQSYIPIINVGIKIQSNYSAYEEGIKYDIFIKNYTGDSNFIGKQVCGLCFFPDFENKRIEKFWFSQFSKFYSKFKIDGVWLTQNEITSLCDGFCEGKFKSKYDTPTYNPGKNKIYKQTLSLSSRTSLSVNYNTHNLYGLEEANCTTNVLEKLRNKRSLVLSRATFPGLGRYSGHWLGDNNATESDMARSIAGILNFNIFGIPLVGADLGGYFLNCTDNLMIRWIQLGAFYPFLRNHAHVSVKNQELYSFSDKVKDIAREMINLRYSLHSYTYTCFYRLHKFGFPLIATPLMVVYPSDEDCLNLESQYLFGDSILVVPSLEIPKDDEKTKNDDGENQIKDVYLPYYFPPDDVWYDPDGKIQKSGWGVKKVAIDEMNYFYRGGNIIVKQAPKYSIKETRDSHHELIAALDENGYAKGYLFLDDGESLDLDENYFYVTYEVNWVNQESKPKNSDCLTYSTFTANKTGHGFSKIIHLKKISIFGIPSDVVRILLNNVTVEFEKYVFNQVLILFFKDLLVYDDFTLYLCHKTTLDKIFQIIFLSTVIFFSFVTILVVIYLIYYFFKRKKDNLKWYEKLKNDDHENPKGYESDGIDIIDPRINERNIFKN